MRWMARGAARGLVLLAAAILAPLLGCALLLLMRAHRGFFDRRYYKATYRDRPFRRHFPQLEFAFAGAFAMKAPNAWFWSQPQALAPAAFAPLPPALRYLMGARRHGWAVAAPAPSPAPEAGTALEAPGAPPGEPYDRFAVLWPQIARDLHGLRDVAHLLTPTEDMRLRLGAARTGAPYAALPSTWRVVMDTLPRRIEHLLLVPWLAKPGGAERVSHRLIAAIREAYPDGGFVVLSPDLHFDVPPGDRGAFGVPVVAFNDIDATLDAGARIELLDRILVQHRPRVVHICNSLTGWLAFRERGAFYAEDSRLFDNLYSDIRLEDGAPVGCFWQFLPDSVRFLSGVIADNATVVALAREHFGLSRAEMARFHVLGTPVVGLGRRPPEADLRPYRDPGRRHSLWMSRIAPEKRIDVLRAVAERRPDRAFSIYGGTIEGSRPVDLSWLDATPNVRLKGRFGALGDLPVEEMDSYIFTTSAEGMPISLLEASMLGLPTVAPAVGGIGELIDAETGWLVDGSDAVDQYVAALDEIGRHPAEAGRRVAAAQRRLVARHSWQSYLDGLSAIPGYLPARSAVHAR